MYIKSSLKATHWNLSTPDVQGREFFSVHILLGGLCLSEPGIIELGLCAVAFWFGSGSVHRKH